MADLMQIPKKYRDILISIPKLSDKTLDEVESALRKVSSIGSEKNTSEIASSIKSLPREEAIGLIETILPLYLMKTQSSKSTGSIVEDVLASLADDASEERLPSKKRFSALGKRLNRLLDLEEADLSAKALSLLLEQSRVCTDTRIVTDIRPVFGKTKISIPKAAVIFHTLKIDYMEEGEEKAFYVTLDTNDIKSLLDTLNRATEKELQLKSFIENTGLKYVEVK